jgi:site-specific DNA recombinase
MSPDQRPVLPLDVYIRVSQVAGRDVEAEGGTAAVQEERCRAALASKGMQVGQVFKDLDVSGGKESRPAFDKAVARIEAGESGGLVAMNLSRFGRHKRVEEQILDIEKLGGTVILVDDSIDTSTPGGRLLLGFMARLNNYYLELTTGDWNRQHKSMIDRGVQAGRAPAGYDKPEVEKGQLAKPLVPNADAPVITKAFEMRLAGKSYNAIARYLNESGVRTQNGGGWTYTTARRLLGNRAYLGEARFGDLVKPDAHPALVDEKTFRRVNLERGREVVGERGHGPILGDGLLRCGVCGQGMVKAKGKSGKYPIYRCPGARSSASETHPTISATAVEKYVAEAVLDRAPELEAGETVPETVPVALTDRLELARADLHDLERQYKDKRIPLATFTAAHGPVSEEVEALEAEIAAYDRGEVFRVQIDPEVILRQKQRETLIALVLDQITPEQIHEQYGDVDLTQDEHMWKASVPAARALIRETLGRIMVLPSTPGSRAPVNERVRWEG